MPRNSSEKLTSTGVYSTIAVYSILLEEPALMGFRKDEIIRKTNFLQNKSYILCHTFYISKIYSKVAQKYFQIYQTETG